MYPGLPINHCIGLQHLPGYKFSSYFFVHKLFMLRKYCLNMSRSQNWSKLFKELVCCIHWGIVLQSASASSFSCGAGDYKTSPCTSIFGKHGYLVYLYTAFFVPQQPLNFETRILNFENWGTQAIGQSNKKAPRPTSGKEYTEGWQWSKGIIAKL